MVSRFCIATSLILGLAIPAFAGDKSDEAKAEKQKNHAEAYAKLDTNGDGKLSFEELRAKFPNYPETKFKARDTNGDGFLTRDEQTAGKDAKAAPAEAAKGKPAPGELFKRADKDGNGVVTLDEIHAIAPNFPQEKFIKLDKDGNGSIEASEITQHAHDPAATLSLALADKDNDGKISVEEAKAATPSIPKERFDQLDTNKDGLLTADELPKPANVAHGDLFHRADANSDGKVTLEELTAVAPKMDKTRFDRFDKNKDGFLTPDEAPGAGGNEPPIAMLVRKADADKNGSVTFDELHAVAPNMTQERFQSFDKNKDGVLSEADRSELAKNDKPAKGDKESIGEGVEKLMETDANKDGKVTFEEVTAAKPGFPKDAFDRADRNKDGVLSTDDAANK